MCVIKVICSPALSHVSGALTRKCNSNKLMGLVLYKGHTFYIKSLRGLKPRNNGLMCAEKLGKACLTNHPKVAQKRKLQIMALCFMEINSHK